MKKYFQKPLFSDSSFHEVFWIIISFALVAPFLILSYYNNPSTDDYAFSYGTHYWGFWGTQWHTYTRWTGRYFSTFLLSAHPLYFELIALYKLLSAVLIVLTIHSIYFFLKNIFNVSNKAVNLSLSSLVTFCFLNGMPTLVQGMYWAPGSLTYHLANSMMLYLITAIVYTCFINPGQVVWKKWFNFFLIFAVCGSNETSMLLLDLILLSFFGFYFLYNRKISKELLFYTLLAIACTVVVVKAPGNFYRDQTCPGPDKHQVYFTIASSFKLSVQYLLQWIASSRILIISVFAVLLYLFAHPFRAKTPKWVILPVVVIGYLLVVAGFSTGLYSTGAIAPDRTLNVPYWIFICTWFSAVFLLLSSFDFVNRMDGKINFKLMLILSAVLLVFLFNRSGNFYLAVTDLYSGKAGIYNKEYKERFDVIKSSGKENCEVSSFSVFPKSVYNGDITDDVETWNNITFAYYVHKKQVKVIFREPLESKKFLLNFENDLHKEFKNPGITTNEISFSQPGSSVMNSADAYSVTFQKTIKDLGLDSIPEISSVYVGVQIYAADSLMDAVLVFCINDKEGTKNILWTGKEIKTSDYVRNSWVKESIVVPLSEKDITSPENVVSVYLWKRNGTKVFLDDLTICFY